MWGPHPTAQARKFSVRRRGYYTCAKYFFVNYIKFISLVMINVYFIFTDIQAHFDVKENSFWNNEAHQGL